MGNGVGVENNYWYQIAA